MKRIDHMSPDLFDGTGFADGLDDEERSRLLEITERRHYEAGEVIVRQGDRSRDVFGLKAGRAEVVKRVGHGDERRLGLLDPGTVFGEIALVLGEPRSATVRAGDEGVELFVLDGEGLNAMRDDEQLAAYKLEHNILRMLAERQSGLNAELVELMEPSESARESDRRRIGEIRERLLEKWKF